MTAPTHRLGGIAAGVVTAYVITPDDICSTALLITGAILGSLVPDIDNRNSSISRKWRLISFFITAGQYIIRVISYLLPKKQAKYVRSLIGHRGLTHSLMAAIIIPLCILGIGTLLGWENLSVYAALGVGVGILSHLLFDIFANGVPLFMPFSIKRVCLAHIKTGGVTEWLFRVTLIIIFISLGLEVIPWEKLLPV